MIALSDLSAISEPFPDWYVPGLTLSQSALSPTEPVVNFPKVHTVAQAKDYAAGSWKTASGLQGIKDFEQHKKALARYRFAHDMAVWGGKLGIGTNQLGRFVVHIKNKILSGNEALKVAKGIGTSSTVVKEPAIATGPPIPETSIPAPTTATVAGMFNRSTLLWLGGAVVLYALIRRR